MVAIATAFIRLAAQGDRASFVREGERMGDQAGRAAGKTMGARAAEGASAELRRGEGRLVRDGEGIGDSVGRAMSRGVGRGSKNAGGDTSIFARAIALSSSRMVLLGAAATAAAPSVLNLTAALAPAAGAALALPAALLAGKAAMATFQLATAGVSDAIKKGFSGSADAAKKALEGLPPAAQRFGRSIIALKPQVDGLRASVSQRFFLPLQDDIRPLAERYFPMLRREMGALAGPLGGIGEQIAESARRMSTMQAVATIFHTTRLSVINLRGAIDPLTHAFSLLISSTAGFLPGLAQGFTNLATRVGAFVTQAARSGQIAQAFRNAMTVIRDLGGILVNVGSILGSVFTAASRGSGTLLGNLRALTGQVAVFLRSAEGSAALTSVFSTLATLGAALRTSLAAVLPAVARSLAIIGPVIAGLAGPASQLVVALAPLLPYFTSLAAIVLRAVTPAIAALAGWLAQNGTTLKIVASALAAGIVAFRVIAIVTRVWAAAQTLLNVVLAANPIGLVIVGLVALGAGLVAAYKHSETFRNIVNAAWNGIKAVVGEVVTWFTGTALPAIRAVWNGIAAGAMWLWRNGIKPAFDGIAAVIRFLYTNVAVPIFAALRTVFNIWWLTVRVIFAAFRAFLVSAIFPVIRFLYNNVVKPIFAGFMQTVRIWWGVLRPIFSAVGGAFRVLGSGVKWVWDHVIRPMFAAFSGYLSRNVAPAFSKGVDAIAAAWNRVRQAAMAPVKFVVDYVINPFIRGLNAAAAAFGIKDRVSQINVGTGGGNNAAPRAFSGRAKGGPIPAYAQGGRIAGMPSSVDNRLAPATIPGVGAVKLAGGEFIVNAMDTAKALPILKWINDGMKRGGPRGAAARIGRTPIDPMGDGSEGWAFAGGGLVGWVKDVWGAISDPNTLIKRPFEAMLGRIPGGAMIRDFVVGAAKKLLNQAVGWLTGGAGGTGGTFASGNVGAAQRFITAQNGKPYIWASAGPRGYDCSGIVSAAYNILKGGNPYRHTFSTGSLPGPWFARGRRAGALVAGWSHPGQSPASSSTGHMAGQLGNLPFESRGSRGVVVGRNARRVGQFANIGAARLAAGGLFEPIRLFDSGGAWPSGTLGANLSGRTEYVSRDSDAGITYELHFHGPVTSEQGAEDMVVRAITSARRKRRIT